MNAFALTVKRQDGAEIELHFESERDTVVGLQLLADLVRESGLDGAISILGAEALKKGGGS